MEPQPKEEIDVINESNSEKMAEMYWSNDETKLVGSMLRTRKVDNEDSKNETELFAKVSKKTDFDDSSKDFLIREAERKVENLGNQANQIGNTQELPGRKEYNYSVKARSKVISDIVLGALRKSGIWGSDESRRVKSLPGFRIDPERRNFSQDEFSGPKISEKGFLPPEEGGPQILSSIFAPQYNVENDLSDERVQKSLSHEIQHVIRSLTNIHLWKGFEEKARENGLSEAKKEIGGFKVGSNMQGSEANGELFAKITELIQKGNNNPTLTDLLPEVADMVKSDLDKAKETGKIRPRYLSAKIALVDHIKQLVNLGFGDIPGIRLVALGSFGYVSYEKLPSLINLGIMTPEKFEKINYVVQNVQSWLTSQSTSGFKLS